jgi:hypothetical protein
MNNSANITEFEPGIFLQIDDVFTGRRKLARVTDTGMAYVDLDDEDATAFPIYSELNPKEAGNILGWGLHIVDHAPQHVEAFRELVDRLITAQVGVLTYNRSAFWAFTHQTFDFDLALRAGVAETEAIKDGRRKMDQVLRNSGATS